MSQENKTVFKEPQTGSYGTPQSKKISRSKQHFELKTIKHFEKKLSIDDIFEKEGFAYRCLYPGSKSLVTMMLVTSLC